MTTDAGDWFATAPIVSAPDSVSGKPQWEASTTAYGRRNRPPPLLGSWRSGRPAPAPLTPVRRRNDRARLKADLLKALVRPSARGGPYRHPASLPVSHRGTDARSSRARRRPARAWTQRRCSHIRKPVRDRPYPDTDRREHVLGDRHVRCEQGSAGKDEDRRDAIDDGCTTSRRIVGHESPQTALQRRVGVPKIEVGTSHRVPVVGELCCFLSVRLGSDNVASH